MEFERECLIDALLETEFSKSGSQHVEQVVDTSGILKNIQSSTGSEGALLVEPAAPPPDSEHHPLPLQDLAELMA